jgi:uncharacterized membrane protein
LVSQNAKEQKKHKIEKKRHKIKKRRTKKHQRGFRDEQLTHRQIKLWEMCLPVSVPARHNTNNFSKGWYVYNNWNGTNLIYGRGLFIGNGTGKQQQIRHFVPNKPYRYR